MSIPLDALESFFSAEWTGSQALVRLSNEGWRSVGKGEQNSAIALSWVVPSDVELIREIDREKTVATLRAKFPRLDVSAAFSEARWLEAHRAPIGMQLGFRVWSDDRLRVGSRWSLELIDASASGSFIARVAWVEPAPGVVAKYEIGFHVLDGDLEALDYLRKLQG